MGACISQDDAATASGAEYRSTHEPVVPLESYFADISDLSARHRMWLDIIDDVGDCASEEGGIPASIRERANAAVQEHCALDATQWRRFMYQELSVSLPGLDEAFDQCMQVAPPSAIGKGKAKPTAAAARIPPSAPGVGKPLEGAVASGHDDDSACLSDAFNRFAMAYLGELLALPSEVHGLHLISKMLLRDDQQDLLGMSPSKMKQGGLVIDEWTVTRRAWMTGWVKLRCFGIGDARRAIHALATQFNAWTLEDPALKALHKFMFRFLPKDHALQQEAIAKEDAVRLIHLELQGKWSLEPYFTQFIQFRYPKRHVTADQWDMLVDFALACRYEVNLLQYEGQANSAWPMLMDEFVEDTMRLLQQDQTDVGSVSALSQ